MIVGQAVRPRRGFGDEARRGRLGDEQEGRLAAAGHEAAGEAARFNQVYAEYKLAPGVTRDRLYIETMERVLSKTNKVVIDSKGASAPIILPPDVFRPRAAPTPAAAAPASSQRVSGGAQ